MYQIIQQTLEGNSVVLEVPVDQDVENWEDAQARAKRLNEQKKEPKFNYIVQEQ